MKIRFQLRREVSHGGLVPEGWRMAWYEPPRRPEWKGRLKLFEAYFLHGADYRRAVRIVGVAEGTFDYWYQEVKRALGVEFSRTGLYPPSRYFKHS